MATTTDTPPTKDRAAETAAVRRAIGREESARKWIYRVLILAVVVAGIVFAIVRVKRARARAKPPRFLTEETSVGDIVETIQSTGTVQPVTQVQVGAQVSGRILKRYVDFNSEVQKGQLLVELDPTIYQSNVAADAARVVTARAAIEGDRANAELAKANYERSVVLNKQGLLGEADLLQAKGAYDGAIAKIHGSEASLLLAEAAARASRTNLTYTKIYAPIDGVVVSRSIDEGQTVAASFQAPVLFTIAQDLRQMNVLADIDEADLGRLSRAQTPEVDVQVSAFPGDIFPGKLSEVRYNATTTQGVVTYPAVIEVSNPDLKLRPGMTATVSIRTAQAQRVVRVPNSALRFKPSPPLGPDGKPRPIRPEPAPPKGKAHVYLPPNGAEEPRARLVDVGVSDGLFTAVEHGTLPAGSKVIVDESDDGAEKQKTRGLF